MHECVSIDTAATKGTVAKDDGSMVCLFPAFMYGPVFNSVTKWSIMADLHTFKCCCSIKTRLI